VVLPHQDPSNIVNNRVEDLRARLTVQDKAGLMFHDIIMMGPGGQLISSDNPSADPPPRWPSGTCGSTTSTSPDRWTTYASWWPGTTGCRSWRWRPGPVIDEGRYR
jgi:hypothetical protein